jgi:hypothetical protein
MFGLYVASLGTSTSGAGTSYPPGAPRSQKRQKDRQHNGQKKKYKRTSNDLPNIHITLKQYKHNIRI